MKLSKWIEIDGYCATRVILGSDPSIISNRFAFIDKTPRIKLKAIVPDVSGSVEEGYGPAQYVWIQGPKGSGGDYETDDVYGKDPDGRKWCDDMLKFHGYELECEDFPEWKEGDIAWYWNDVLKNFCSFEIRKVIVPEIGGVNLRVHSAKFVPAKLCSHSESEAWKVRAEYLMKEAKEAEEKSKTTKRIPSDHA